MDNVGIAMGLVIAAGASTGLGAAVVFFPSIVKLASRRVLAGSLGFSAGVMSYVSFIEIFGKARSSFEDAGFDEGKAYGFATLCFFGGVGTMTVSFPNSNKNKTPPPAPTGNPTNSMPKQPVCSHFFIMPISFSSSF